MDDKMKYGEFLPNARVDRIMLESDGPSRMKIGVDLSVSYKYEANTIGSWFKNKDFRQYIKIKIVQSTVESQTDRLNKRSTKSRKELLTTTTPHGAEPTVHILTIDDITGSGEPIDTYSYQNSDGDSINKLVFHKKFTLATNNPSHLSYFAFTYLDIEAINDHHGTELKLSEESAIGSIFAETAIKRGRIFGKSHIFFTPDGKTWPGAVHRMPNGQWMTGDNPNHPPYGEEGAEVNLTMKQVPNNKVHDFRQFEKIKRLEIDLSVFEKDILPAQNKFAFLKSDNMNPTKKPVYFSDIYLTTDRANRPIFGFSVDYDRMVKDTSVFGRLYETRMSVEKNIKSLSIKRRRVEKSKNNNKLGSPVNSATLFENSIVERVLITEDNPSGLAEVSDDNGGISELDLSASNNSGIRFFNAYDKSVASLSDGLYQYGVELVLEDQTVKFLKEQFETLLEQKNDLYKYYLECQKVGTTRSVVKIDNPHIDHFWERELVKESTPGNYDPISNRFTQEFINKNAEYLLPTNAKGWNPNAPWARPIYSYFNALSVITDFDNFSDRKSIVKNILTMVSPPTGTPQGVNAVIKLMSDLISKLGDLIGNDSQGINAVDRSHTSTSKLPVKITTIEHWFTNDHFNSKNPKNIGYDYLSTSIGALSISGLRLVKKGDYIARVKREHEKYGLIYSDELNSGFYDFAASWSYLTPSYCFFGSNEKNKIFDFAKMKSHDQYSTLEANIVSYNTTNVPTEKGIYEHTESSKKTPANKELTPYDTYLKERLSDFYAEMNLTIKPTSDRGGDNLNPNELFQSLLKTFSKTGLANHDSTENQYNEYGKSISLGYRKKEIDAKGLTIDFYQSTIEQILASNPESTTLGGQILANCGVPQNHPFLNNLGYKYIEANKMGPLVKNRLPLQIRFLMNSQSSSTGDLVGDPKSSSYFHFNHSMINTVEVLTGFSANTPDSRLSNPTWQPLTQAIWESSKNGRVLICRMKPFNCAVIGIEHPKGLKLPVYNNYFMLEPKSPNSAGYKKPTSIVKYESLDNWLRWARRE